jgi:hypothetical protein
MPLLLLMLLVVMLLLLMRAALRPLLLPLLPLLLCVLSSNGIAVATRVGVPPLQSAREHGHGLLAIGERLRGRGCLKGGRETGMEWVRWMRSKRMIWMPVSSLLFRLIASLVLSLIFESAIETGIPIDIETDSETQYLSLYLQRRRLAQVVNAHCLHFLGLVQVNHIGESVRG